MMEFQSYDKSVKYQIVFTNGTRHPGKFDTKAEAKEYADNMAWFGGYSVVKVRR
jgi:hypothetical protein